MLAGMPMGSSEIRENGDGGDRAGIVDVQSDGKGQEKIVEANAVSDQSSGGLK
jgi:hypothetical protein